MPIKHADVENAYRVLGLDEGASVEVVRTTYKQIALKTHPDKNPGNADATAQFQRVSAAYKLLMSYLEDGSDESDFDYDDDSDFEYYDLPFCYFLFENLMRGGPRGYYSYGRFRREHAPPETPEEYAARLRRSREEQAAAAERRKAEAAARKLRAEQERERERIQAEERHKAKVEEKKSQAAAQRAQAVKKLQDQQRKSQNLRSAVFAAARKGNVDQVKKGIWESDVDAAGGEIKSGCDAFVKAPPLDPKETLLHIAARRGDRSLVEWLDTHNADVEERDSNGLTAFHVAVELGNIPITTYFIETYPPQDSDNDNMYTSSPAKSVLALAVESGEPEIVYLVLKDKISVKQEDLNQTWAWISSAQGLGAMKKKYRAATEKIDDIIKLLMIHGGFSPPSTPNLHDLCPEPVLDELKPKPAPPPKPANRGRNKKRGKGRS